MHLQVSALPLGLVSVLSGSLACPACLVPPDSSGPNVQPCPTNCTTCDDGITGSGICLKPVIPNIPSNFNCLNGLCGSNGQCACDAGFTKASNGTACATCSPGFSLSSTGDCLSTDPSLYLVFFDADFI